MIPRRPAIALLAALALAIPSPTYPCSSFACSNKGALVFATNYDNSWAPGYLFVNARNIRKSGWERGTTGRVAAWTSRHGSVTISVVGPQIAWGGMNEKGLAFSTMLLAGTRVPPPDERPPLAGALWWQYMLDTCATVEDVKRAAQSVRITDTEDHYLVCDGTGACAVVEVRRGKVQFRGGNDLPVKALTNAPYGDCLGQLGKWHSAPTSPYHSFNRFSRLAAGIPRLERGRDSEGIQQAFDLLADVASTQTRWSLVLDTGQRVFHLRSYENRRTRYVDLKRIDFARGGPMLMLDAHANLEGDITGAFHPYRHDEIAPHLLAALAHFRPEMPQDTALAILAHVERFTSEPAGHGPGTP
jgi:penicillin V acylase-like amidase (Ntn superfamily)